MEGREPPLLLTMTFGDPTMPLPPHFHLPPLRANIVQNVHMPEGCCEFSRAPQTFPTAIFVVCWHFTSQSHSLAFSVTFLFTLIFIHEFVFHFVSYAYYGNEQSTWGKN